MKDASTLRLYDDGTHGDTQADDRIYGNRFQQTDKEGVYAFHFRAGGPTGGGNAFDRDSLMQKQVAIKVASGSSLIDISRLVGNAGRLYQVPVMPSVSPSRRRRRNRRAACGINLTEVTNKRRAWPRITPDH